MIFGGCLCEKVRYKISSPPVSQGICYCRQCQRSGGMFGSPLLVLLKESFECSSEGLGHCATKSDRGSVVTRYFCKDCGSPIFSKISDVAGIVTVKASTLDDVGVFVPEYLVWIASAPPSCPLPTGVPAFEGSAPLELVMGRLNFTK